MNYRKEGEPDLGPFERWMVKQGVEAVKAEGVEVVVARLKANGYDRIARAVQQAVDTGVEPSVGA